MDELDAKIIVASYSITCSQIRRFTISLIVEGSSDGGSNWYVLDRQTSQKFDSRFQRKLYRVGLRHTQSNAISTRQPHSNSRTTSQHWHQAGTATCGISSIAQLQKSAPERLLHYLHPAGSLSRNSSRSSSLGSRNTTETTAGRNSSRHNQQQGPAGQNQQATPTTPQQHSSNTAPAIQEQQAPATDISSNRLEKAGCGRTSR